MQSTEKYGTGSGCAAAMSTRDRGATYKVIRLFLGRHFQDTTVRAASTMSVGSASGVSACGHDRCETYPWKCSCESSFDPSRNAIMPASTQTAFNCALREWSTDDILVIRHLCRRPSDLNRFGAYPCDSPIKLVC